VLLALWQTGAQQAAPLPRKTKIARLRYPSIPRCGLSRGGQDLGMKRGVARFRQSKEGAQARLPLHESRWSAQLLQHLARLG